MTNFISQPVSLREIGYFYGGLTGKSGKDFGRGNSKYITFMNVINNVIAKSDLTDYVEVKDGERQNKVSKGDLLFNGSSETPEEVAFPSLVTRDLEGLYLNSFCFGFRFEKSDIVDPLFFAYYLRSNYGRQFMSQLAQGSTRYNISKRALLDIEWNIPKIEEQKAIAGALSDIDELIDSLKQEIHKRINLFQAALTFLLPISVSVENPPLGWQTFKLKELGHFHKGRGITKSEIRESGLACIRYGEIYTKFSAVIDQIYSYIDAKTAATSVRIKTGDILLAGSGETKEDIGKATAYLFNDEAYVGGDIIIFRPVNSDSRFLGYLLNSPMVTPQKSRAGKGDAVVHISASDLEEIIVSIPQREEQINIGQRLFEIEDSIAICEQQLSKVRMLKQGIMNDLLTGRVRLV